VGNFCEHCLGQRFDRAQVLRTLRKVREDLREKGHGSTADEALVVALNAVRGLEIPHLELEEDMESQVVH